MNISYDKEHKTFSVETEGSGYYIALADGADFAGHVHYGKKLGGQDDLAQLLRVNEYPFTPSKLKREKLSFFDAFQWVYPCGGMVDYRERALDIRNGKGQSAVSLSVRSHEIVRGKKALNGLPATWGEDKDCMTLVLHCADDILNLEVDLYYSVFEGIDAIARHAEIKNCGNETLEIRKALSLCMDMDRQDKEFDFISLHGSWARERHMDRVPLHHGKSNVYSTRGETGHQMNNFAALAERNADWDRGEVYGLALLYSGNFITQAELNQFDSVRFVTGINPETFSWQLNPGERFVTPEAVLVWSDKGLNGMSQEFHNLWRTHLIRGSWRDKSRPVLINNWEATFFDFDTDKLIAFAGEAAKHGIEMLVMDDGWFGHRNSDDSSLGDWFVNEDKLKGGLAHLVSEVNKLGLKFGIWFEPEMISPDSELYRQHPDWAIQVAGREPGQARQQFVLDISRKEVRDCIYGQIKKVLESANIEYVKWDMNRPLSDLGSSCLSTEQAGELSHRYVLGLYEMQERLVTDFPGILLENCSGGGGRFDAGMLYYSPQIWCSDDTDAVERLAIQEGTALVYPLSSMGAHVSVCPSQACGRNTPFRTRGYVALAGTFGYELDITKMADDDKSLIDGQIDLYHMYNPLVREGDYYKIASSRENGNDYDAWEVVSKDKTEALVTVVQVLAKPNSKSRKIIIKGLDPARKYRAEMEDSTGKKQDLGTWSALTLQGAGLLLPRPWGDFQGQLVHLKSER
ncbi:MAG: alpha-galactosidase, partial [Treponema sp.]|nr:alpha-galactosidase [Treponema sp.]